LVHTSSNYGGKTPKNHSNRIGGYGYTEDGSFNGKIDDVRVYNRALSPEEIGQLYFDGLDLHVSELAIFDVEGAIDEKVEALERIDTALQREWQAYGVLEEMLDSKDYGDLNKRDIIRARQGIHSTMQHQERAADTLDKSIDELYDVLTSLGWEPEPNEPPGPNEPNGSNLIAHWKFDEGSGGTAYDSVGDNDGTLVNGPVWTSGRIGGALSFDGVDDYVNISSFSMPQDSFTIQMWIKKRGSGSGGSERFLTSVRRDYATEWGVYTGTLQYYQEWTDGSSIGWVDIWSILLRIMVEKHPRTILIGLEDMDILKMVLSTAKSTMFGFTIRL
jgi:hypothetical protein